MPAPVVSHYQRLGVTAAASTEEIRASYRALASRLHPDRLAGSTPPERALAERRMREINESWRVLQDPARRRAYDDRWLADRRPTAPAAGPRSVAPAPAADDEDLVDVLPPMTALSAGLFRHLPWVVLVVVFGLIFVMTAYAGGSDDPSGPVAETQTEAGSCIDLRSGTATTIVPCDGPHEFRITASVAKPTECPPGSEPRRFAPDGHFDCLVAP